MPELNDRFRKWFGNSKVVDSNGSPLIVYHGTSNDFNQFSYDKNRQTGTDYGEAYYFTTDHEKASGYGYNANKDKTALELKQQEKEVLDKMMSLLSKEDGKMFKSEDDRETFSTLEKERQALADKHWNRIQHGTHKDTESGKVLECYLKMENPLEVDANGAYYYQVYEKYFKQLGNHDGIIIHNVIDNPRGEARPIDVYIVFKPNQIKSVENNGDWSMTSTNIYERLEALDDDKQLFATQSVYDLKNLLQNKPKEYRLFFDPNINYWLIATADDYIHFDMVKAAQKMGLYYNCDIMNAYISPNGYADIDGYMYEIFDNDDCVRLIFTVDYNKSRDLGSDDFDYAYIYDFGTILSRDEYYEDSELAKILGTYQKESTYDKSENLNEDDLLDWFGNSKVVDEKGQPLICYHGTNTDFTKFDKSMISSNTGANWFGKGFYFSTSKSGQLDDSANWYGEKIIKAYLKVEKPFITYNDDNETLNKLAELEPNMSVKRSNHTLGEIVKVLNKEIDPNLIQIEDLGRNKIAIYYDGVVIEHSTWSVPQEQLINVVKSKLIFNEIGRTQILLRDLYPDEITYVLKKHGYDGIFELPQIIVFEPKQIRVIGINETLTINKLNEAVNRALQ